MRYVGYDQMRRRAPLGGMPRRPSNGLLLPGLIFLSVALLILSRLDHGYIAGVRGQVTELMNPVLRAAMVPLEPIRAAARTVSETFTLHAELDRLRNENQRLKGWEWRAVELERKFADLSAAAQTARDTQIAFITARVIANSSGAFVRSATINAGQDQGLKAGYPVLSGDGLVGRVVDAGSNASRILLLTDAQSRVPVHVGRTGTRAVLTGSNGPNPRLVFSAPDVAINAGDVVSTSGVGGFFPRGLRIGTVLDANATPSVRLDADLDTIEYLGVLLYDTPALDLLGAARSLNGAAAARTGRE